MYSVYSRRLTVEGLSHSLFLSIKPHAQCALRKIGMKGGKISYLRVQFFLKLWLFRPLYNDREYFNQSTAPPLPLKIMSAVHKYACAHLPQHGEKFCTKRRRIGFGPLGVITLCYRATEGCVVWELQKEMMRRDPCGPSSPPVLPHSSQFWLKSKLREWEGPAIYMLSIPAVYVHCTCVLYTVQYVYSVLYTVDVIYPPRVTLNTFYLVCTVCESNQL